MSSTLRAIDIRTGKFFGELLSFYCNNCNSNKMTAALYEINDSVHYNSIMKVIGVGRLLLFRMIFRKNVISTW
jgi:hypothetical protein